MQEIFTLTPYHFLNARKARWLSKLSRVVKLHRWLNWKREGVRGHEVRGQERLRASLAAGHSILLAPNHSRTADPISFGFLAEEMDLDMYVMASWHVFNQGWFSSQFVRGIGAFSVNREGTDRAAVEYAVKILEENDRPLIVFPEGSTSRTQDRLMPFLDGLSFIARTGAKKRAARDSGATVIHPIAIRYRFEEDLLPAIQPVLEQIEQRLTWQPNRVTDLLPRLERIGLALLTIKEVEVFGHEQSGTLPERLAALIEGLLQPLEIKWLGATQTGTSSARIKALRTRILPEMTEGKLNEEERQRRFSDLRDTYVAHQMACYPLDYLSEYPSVDRIRETVERFEEDMSDQSPNFRPIRCIMEIGPAIPVSTDRAARRTPDGDPLMNQVAAELQSLLTALGQESPLLQ